MRTFVQFLLPVILVVLMSSCAVPSPIASSIPTFIATTPTDEFNPTLNSSTSLSSQSTLPVPSFTETEQYMNAIEGQIEETPTTLPWVAFVPGDAERAEGVLLEFLLHITRYEVDQAAVLSAEPYEYVQNLADYFRMYCEQWERCYQPRQVIFLNPGFEMEGNWFGVEFEQDDGKLWKPATFCCGSSDWIRDPMVLNLAPLSRYSVVKTADGNFLVNYLAYAMFDY